MPNVLIKNNYNNLKTATKSLIRIVRYEGRFLFCVHKYDSKHLYFLTATHIIFPPNVIDPNSIINRKFQEIYHLVLFKGTSSIGIF